MVPNVALSFRNCTQLNYTAGIGEVLTVSTGSVFLFVCLFLFLASQPIVVVFAQPGSGL
jgi:hypothetical protein